jgi:2-C-methyl-D-erythritol 4-phosphate cytidylyltransferase
MENSVHDPAEAAEEAERPGDVSVIIPAAGASNRMGGDVRKPFLELNGEPIILRTCRRLASAPGVFEIVLAVHPDDLESVQGPWWNAFAAAGATLAVAGGGNRAESVWEALQVVSARAALVAVHDAVRPFVRLDTLKALFSTARRRGAAVPVAPLVDTPKRIEGDRVVETPRRLGLMRAQTPQVFKSDLLIEAYEYALSTGGLSETITDDSLLVEKMGAEVAAVFGDESNIKITSPRDLKLAAALLAAGLAE